MSSGRERNGSPAGPRPRRRRWTAAALALALLAAPLALRLPEPLFRDPWSTVLLDGRGDLLGACTAADEQWRFPPGDSLPARWAEAAVEFEDRRFRSHPGVDPLAVGRALLQNLRAGRTVSGASTITMQVLRLSRGNPPRTLAEKVREALLALRLEARCSKEEILALYAAHAPMGGNVVGLEAAAWRWFGRAPADLGWAEAALLAVLPNDPALLRPGRNSDALRAKRDRLLRRLADAGRLSPLDLELAMAEPLPAGPRPVPRAAPHLFQRARARAGESTDPAGHRVVATLDPAVQRRATELLQERLRGLSDSGVRNMAALVLDLRSGRTLAYVGNAAASPQDAPAVDLVPARRSTGSLLKPFLYAARLEEGSLLPESLVEDVPTHLAGYAPRNFDEDFRGALPASRALALSLNVPAVRQLRDYGAGRFFDLLRRLGLGGLSGGAEHYGLALVLGAAEGSLWDLCGLYAGLGRAASGDARPLRAPAWLAGGEDPGRAGPFGAAAAWLTLEALREVERPDEFGDWRRYSSAGPVAWKTGTSFGRRDAWAIGVTPDYCVGVWAGAANGVGAPEIVGLRAAAPAMLELAGWLSGGSGGFPQPVTGLRRVEICALSGHRAGPDCEERAWSLAPDAPPRGATCPYHRRIFVDRAGRWRLHGDCASLDSLVAVPWFLLPADVEPWWRRRHLEYREPPPWRPDCLDRPPDDAGALALVYPGEGAVIQRGRGFDGELGACVFVAEHRRADAVVHWHLDDRYLGATVRSHSLSVEPGPGPHRLLLVDEDGASLSRAFSVVADPATRFAAGDEAAPRSTAGSVGKPGGGRSIGG